MTTATMGEVAEKAEVARANLYKIQQAVIDEMTRCRERLAYLKLQQANIRECIHAVAKEDEGIIEHYTNNPEHHPKI